MENVASICGSRMIVGCMQFLYGMPINYQYAPGNSFGIPEYARDFFLQSDLDNYTSTFQPRALGASINVLGIGGGNNTLDSQVFAGYSFKVRYPYDFSNTLVLTL